jgi:hypothetical protein
MCFFAINVVNGQINNNGLFKNYSKSGNSYSDVFHGITINAAFDCKSMPFFGIGYTCLQFSTRNNRFTQESITYNLGLELGNQPFLITSLQVFMQIILAE